MFPSPFSGFLEVCLGLEDGQTGWPLASFLLGFHLFSLLGFHKMFFLKKKKKHCFKKYRYLKVSVLNIGYGGGRVEICQAEPFVLPLVGSGKPWRPRSRGVMDSASLEKGVS